MSGLKASIKAIDNDAESKLYYENIGFHSDIISQVRFRQRIGKMVYTATKLKLEVLTEEKNGG